MSKREAFEAWWDDFKSTHEEWPFADKEALLLCAYQAGLASQAQLDSNLHWCGTCEQNVDCGCGDSACQYRYKLPPAPMNEVNKPEGEKE